DLYAADTGIQTVEVQGGASTAIEFHMTSAGQITGTVLPSPSGLPQPSALEVQAVPVAWQSQGAPVWHSKVAANNTFAIPGLLVGEYTVFLHDPTGEHSACLQGSSKIVTIAEP